MRVLYSVVFLAFLLHGVKSAEVTPCCLPKQWSGNLVQTIGEYNRDLDAASIAYANADYFYDSTGNQLAFREFRDNQTMQIKSHRLTIMKYDQMMKYVIENTTCTKSKLSDKMTPPCIPDDATHFGTHMYPTGIKADVWFFKDDGQKRLTVSQKCMPLSLSHISSGPDYILTTSLYQNVTQGITDPTVFIVPGICNQQQRDQAVNKNVAGVVDMEAN